MGLNLKNCNLSKYLLGWVPASCGSRRKRDSLKARIKEDFKEWRRGKGHPRLKAEGKQSAGKIDHTATHR